MNDTFRGSAMFFMWRLLTKSPPAANASIPTGLLRCQYPALRVGCPPVISSAITHFKKAIPRSTKYVSLYGTNDKHTSPKTSGSPSYRKILSMVHRSCIMYRLTRSHPVFLSKVPVATLGTRLNGRTYSTAGSARFENEDAYWRRIPQWQDITAEEFISYRWQTANTVTVNPRNTAMLERFLATNLPSRISGSKDARLRHIQSREQFIEEVFSGIEASSMSPRLTPHILSVINWQNPLDDPIRRQFIPIRSSLLPDHPALEYDSLHEEEDSAVPGLVHRYPTKALFLATSICPVYCSYCTRSYAVGVPTKSLNTKSMQKPSRKRWEVVFNHIENTPVLEDIVVSGGDTYMLQPKDILEIGTRLLSIPHINRIRFATKGLAVMPGRTLDLADGWTEAFIELSNQGRKAGKHVCIHTHFNHPNEITWVTREAAKYLFKHGVIVRNQSVLLKGVNDDAHTMGTLITELAKMNYQPYYVYQCDLVPKVEHLRTPLKTIIDLEKELRGTIGGFMLPNFICDLPGGGGKRLACSYESYENGVSTYRAPGLTKGDKGEKVYAYHDPLPSQDLIADQVHEEIYEEAAYPLVEEQAYAQAYAQASA